MRTRCQSRRWMEGSWPVTVRVAVAAVLVVAVIACGGSDASSTSDPKSGDELYPDVVGATAFETEPGTWTFEVTISSRYDSADRYADAFRIFGEDGTVYGSRELLHDHATEQPFTRSLESVEIPDEVDAVVVQGHDLVNGWGGASVEVALPSEGGGEVSRLRMTVEGVRPGEPIPTEFTCDGANRLPPVTVSSVPEGVAELALIVDDPDAPRQDPFVHWVVYGIDPSLGEITDDDPGLVHGVNDAGSARWSGPCPPRGNDPHTYHWRLFALDKRLDLPAGLDGRELEQAIGADVMDRAEVTATYRRGG